MTSFCRHLSPTAQEIIVNWVTTADGCVYTADTTQLYFAVGKFVQTRRDCRQLVANSVHTTDATQLDSLQRPTTWILCEVNFDVKTVHRL